jgi:hypothetical protein
MAQLISGTTIDSHIAIHAGNLAAHNIATTSYVTTQINNLIDGAPGALDTLNELAAALGDNANFATAVTDSIAGKVSKAGDAITGKITFPSAVVNRPQFPGGILGLDTGDGNFDIWGISRDYYPSHATAANAWGLRWNGDNNDFEFVGGGTSRVILDMDGGNLTITGTISASGYNASNWNTAFGWGNHAGLYAAASHNHTSLTGVTSIGFNAQSSDAASITTTVSGTQTFFDFNLTDDNDNDWWRWRFTPSGSTVYDAMTLKPVSNGNADLTVSGSVYADNLAISNWNTAYGWGNHASAGYLSTSGKAADSELIDGIDSSRIVYGDGNKKSTNYSTMDGYNMPSGFFFYNQPTGNPFSDWTNWINVMGNSWDNNYGFQLAHAFHSDQFAVRRVTNGSFASWRTILDGGNWNNYAPGLTGGGASGTWSINISGTAARATRANGNFYIDDNYGNSIVGLYSSTRYQGVFAMGDSYKLAADGSSPGSLYGIAWTHTNAGGESKPGLEHQALFMMNGRTYTAIGSGIWTDGTITTTSHGTSANWLTAYNKRPTAVSFSGSSTKTLTLTLGDGSTLTATFNDIDTDTNTDSQTLSLSGNTLSISGGNSVTLSSSGISQATADSLYVNVTGDTMSGALIINSPSQGAEAFAVNGVNGRLFTVVDDLSDSLYSVNTLAGLPVLEIFANNIVQIGKFGTNAIYVGQDGRVGFGTTNFSYTAADQSSPSNNRVFVNGSIQLLSNNDAIVFGRGTATVLKDESLAFGWGGGWFMEDATYLRVHGNKMVYSGGSARFDDSLYLGGQTYRFYSANSGLWTNGNLGADGDIYLGTRGNWLSTYLNQAVRTDSSPTFSQVYTNNWFRNNSNNTGLYNEANANHFYSRSGTTWSITGAGGNIILEFRSNHESTLRGSVYADTSNQIGFLNNGNGWSFRTNSSNNAFVHGTDLTINADGAGSSNIIMNDGDEGSRTIHCNSNRIGFLTQSGSWGAYADDSGNWTAANFSGSSSGTNTGDQTNISGNAATATYATSAGSASTASQVTINYNNNSNSTYQLLWGSGNSVYGTAEVYVNPSNDHVYAGGFYSSADIYLGTRGTWLSSWLNQALLTTSDPTFNSTYFANGNLRLYQGNGTALHIQTAYGNVQIGPQNGSWMHFETDRPNFYFGRAVHVNGAVYRYGGAQHVEADGGNWNIAVPRLYASGNKAHYLGESSSWDGTGFGSLTNLHFQGHDHFWIGAGNAYWWGGGISTEHDLLISTMYGYASQSYYRGITFAVENNGNGSNGGYRLGRWQAYGGGWDTARLQVDASLSVGYGNRLQGSAYNEAKYPLDRGVWAHGRDQGGYGDDRVRSKLFSPTANGGGPWGSFASLEVSSVLDGNNDIPALFRMHQWGSGSVEFWKPQGRVLYVRESPGGSGSWFDTLNVQARLDASSIYDAGSRVAISRGEGRNYVDYSRYVYNNGAYSGSGWIEPSDLGVRYAAGAGNADTVDGFHADSFYRNLGFGSGYPSWALNSVAENRSGFTYSNEAPYTGPFLYVGASGYGFQMNANYGDGTLFAYRVRNGDNGTWSAWRRLMYESGTWNISVTGSAGSVAWGNVSGRPTNLSSFTNDLGNYGGWITSSGTAANADRLYPFGAALNDTHPGYGLRAWYDWAYSGTYRNGISLGSNPGDQAYGWQLWQNMWDDRTYTRRYNGGWQTTRTLMTAQDDPYAYNMNQYVRTSDGPTFAEVYTNGWFRSTGHQGHYNPTNGAHFYPSDNSYCAWKITGNRSGWGGLNMQDPSGFNHYYMHESGNGGLLTHDRWAWYWSRGNACLGLAGSDTSSSYRVYVAGALYATDDIVAYSDRRKKTDIITIDNAVEKVSQMRGVYYTKIGDEAGGRKTGVIAQEINEVLPEVVTYAQDVDEYGVSYGNIAGVLIEAIKEQQKQIADLREEIKKLKGE